jgi:hypothetical protein
MTIYNQNSQYITVFHGLPSKGNSFAGYSALISAHDLKVPAPDHLCAIGVKHKKYDMGRWRIFTPRHKPENTLFKGVEINGKKIQKSAYISIIYIEKASVLVYSC